MKKILFTVVTIVAVCIGVINVNLNCKSLDVAGLSLKKLEALTLEIETGAGITTQSECQTKLGYWNMALICSGGGVNSFRCEIQGQLTIAGVTIMGGYKKGKSYNIVWEQWSCTTSSGNCCIASSQGVYIN
jgi:hypothetical protein